MGVAYAAERGLLAEDEFAMVEQSHYPALAALDGAALRDLAKWLRARRARARDILHDRTRAKRGKGEPRGTVSEPGTAHNLADKKQVFARALKRVNARIEAEKAAAKRAQSVARLQAALARKQAAGASHPEAGATPAGVLIALDRQERGQGELSAVQEVKRDYGIPVIAVAGLADLMSFLAHHSEFAAHQAAVAAYRERYGVDA
jgi:hypothetical protein